MAGSLFLADNELLDRGIAVAAEQPGEMSRVGRGRRVAEAVPSGVSSRSLKSVPCMASPFQ
jgi:hypothetical protein